MEDITSKMQRTSREHQRKNIGRTDCFFNLSSLEASDKGGDGI
jgi:hypothetical protein